MNFPRSNQIRDLMVDGKIRRDLLPDAILGTVQYKGTWDATTNTPTLPAAAAANSGHYYKVSVAGTTNVGGITDWDIGDWVISNGTNWEKIDNSEMPETAKTTSYENAASGLTATNVQTAVDELATRTSQNSVAIGNLTQLTTENKTTFVDAVNEVKNTLVSNKSEADRAVNDLSIRVNANRADADKAVNDLAVKVNETKAATDQAFGNLRFDFDQALNAVKGDGTKSIGDVQAAVAENKAANDAAIAEVVSSTTRAIADLKGSTDTAIGELKTSTDAAIKQSADAAVQAVSELRGTVNTEITAVKTRTDELVAGIKSSTDAAVAELKASDAATNATIAELKATDAATAARLAQLDPANNYVNAVPAGAVDGTARVFTLPSAPIGVTLMFGINGIDQEVDDDYQLIGNQLSLKDAPFVGDRLRVRYWKAA